MGTSAQITLVEYLTYMTELAEAGLSKENAFYTALDGYLLRLNSPLSSNEKSKALSYINSVEFIAYLNLQNMKEQLD